MRENIGAFVHALLLAKPVGLKKSKSLHNMSLPHTLRGRIVILCDPPIMT